MIKELRHWQEYKDAEGMDKSSMRVIVRGLWAWQTKFAAETASLTLEQREESGWDALFAEEAGEVRQAIAEIEERLGPDG